MSVIRFNAVAKFLVFGQLLLQGHLSEQMTSTGSIRLAPLITANKNCTLPNAPWNDAISCTSNVTTDIIRHSIASKSEFNFRQVASKEVFWAMICLVLCVQIRQRWKIPSLRSSPSSTVISKSLFLCLLSIQSWSYMLGAALVIWQLFSVQDFLSVLHGITSGFSAWYMESLDSYPMLTKAITTGSIQFLGDIGAQWREEQTRLSQQTQRSGKSSKATTTSIGNLSFPKWYDLRRGLSCLSDGLLISGPLMHICYETLEEWIPTDDVAEVATSTTTTEGLQGFLLGYIWSSSNRAALTHVLINDVFLDAVFIAITFIITGFGEGYGREILTQFQVDYWPAVRTSWIASIALVPIEFVIFRFLPRSLRSLGMNCIDIYWEALISFMVHRHRKKGRTVAVDCGGLGGEAPVHTTQNEQQQK